MRTVTCAYCGQPAELVNGEALYPRRSDLWTKNFWRCKPCEAWVGCHAPKEYGNGGVGDGTVPLGRLANAELRTAKTAAHAAFDTLWQSGEMSRGQAYKWLANALGLPEDRSHIGEFDLELCRAVLAAVNEKEATPSAIALAFRQAGKAEQAVEITKADRKLVGQKGLSYLTGTRVERFVDAQNHVYDRVCAELRAGRKKSHWMWFVFPQLKGLGSSGIAAHFGIESVEEAQQYVRHAVLGPRLVDCTELVLEHSMLSLHDIFGSPDDLKFRSCMTLFQQVATEESCFARAIGQFCGGDPDSATLQMLGKNPLTSATPPNW